MSDQDHLIEGSDENYRLFGLNDGVELLPDEEVSRMIYIL
jgi:hypothetical protein